MGLTLEQQRWYREQGFLSLPAFALPGALCDLCEIYDALFAARAGRDAGDHFDLAGTDEDDRPARLPQLMNPVQYAPQLRDAPFRRAALQLAQGLLGDAVEAGDEHAICKPAEHGAVTPWHQDQAYWDPGYEYEALSVWIPLQPVDAASGCLHFVPQSHLGDVVPHRSIRGDRRVHGLETESPVDASCSVACPLPLGGCTVHHCRTLHFAGPNTTRVPRRAYILTYRLPPVPRAVPREFPWLAQRTAPRQARARQAEGQR